MTLVLIPAAKVALAVGVSLAAVLLSAPPAVAAGSTPAVATIEVAAPAGGRMVELAEPVRVDPTAEGMPGATLGRKLLNWLGQLALWGSLASILVGAALYGLSQQAGYATGATRGRTLALAGVVGAIMTGLGPTVVNLLFDAARGA